ncbi:hypothetical protein ANN_22321 [Periplaneta americana]|uniref:Uncharacterized protein n=1 Tax=Periplaneta americana TaxID=6978 RepID=A0ABQ8S8A3_PERAM|nr:hypothetical protein ANN_22321 [Periplaneta americana]
MAGLCEGGNELAVSLKAICYGRLEDMFLTTRLYMEALCAKSVALNNVMSVVVNCVNFIKSSSLRNRQFKELLEELGSHYENVPYYCHVRWLSRGALLRRFFQLRCEINNFMKKQGHEVPELTQEEWLCDLAFSTDLFHHLDILNMSLQGKDKNDSPTYKANGRRKRKITYCSSVAYLASSVRVIIDTITSVAVNDDIFSPERPQPSSLRRSFSSCTPDLCGTRSTPDCHNMKKEAGEENVIRRTEEPADKPIVRLIDWTLQLLHIHCCLQTCISEPTMSVTHYAICIALV